MAAVAATAGLLLPSACSGGSEVDASVSPTAAASTDVGELFDRLAAQQEQAEVEARELGRLARERVTPADVDLVRGFVRWAVAAPGPVTSEVRFAPKVRLGVGTELSQSLARRDAARLSSWVLDVSSFAGMTGPFSALRRIRDHARSAGSAVAGGRDAAFDVQVGPHLRCSGGQPAPTPAGLDTRRRVSLQPSASSTESCLDWFSVDLFLDPAGRIEAVTLDVWEP